MASHELGSVALTLVAEGKGILAADETIPTLTRRFDTLGIQSTEQSRRTYREMLFTSAGIAEFISGVIMYDDLAAHRSPKLSRVRASFQASRSIPAQSPLPALMTRPLPRGLMVYGIVSGNIMAWVPGSRSGGRSSISATLCRVPLA